MVWRKKIRKPQIGDARVVTKFLWSMITIKGETRWLEKASYVQRFGQIGPREYTRGMTHELPSFEIRDTFSGQPVWVNECWGDQIPNDRIREWDIRKAI